MNKEELNFLLKEADELVAIFSAAIRTIKSKNPKSQILNLSLKDTTLMNKH